MARALYFPPTNTASEAPYGELPPLLVAVAWRPDVAASSALSLDRAFFTSRGIAVVDVDYRGSTGYGRPYRDALNGEWGIVDVEDCVAAAQFLAVAARWTAGGLAIQGGSAGGFTTLAALTFRPEIFAAGISHYGIADLEMHPPRRPQVRVALRRGAARPVAGGPARVPGALADPRVRPCRRPDADLPGSGRPGRAALAARCHGGGVEPRDPVRRDTFEGEGHGFRRADSRRRVYAAELSFLGQVFGFTPADAIEPIAIEHLAPTA